MREQSFVERPPFRPDWRCVNFNDIYCNQGFDWVPGMAEAEEKHQTERKLVCLLEKHNSIVAATADLQHHIQTLLLLVKQRVYPAALEIGFQTISREPAVKAFLTEFLDHALLLKHPLVLAIEQGSIKLPAHKTPQVDRSMYSLRVLQLSVQASIEQNLKLHSSYREHCNVVTKLLEVLTYTPHGCYGLPGQLVHICSVPEHKLPCSRAAAYAWRTEVKRLSPLFLFRDPCQLTRADLGPVEASCFFTASDTLQDNWQLLLEAAPAPCSPSQSHGSSGTASDDDDICNDSSGYAYTAAATSCVSSPASQRPPSAAYTQPPTPTPPPQQPKVSFLSRAAARVKGAVGTVVSWCVSAVKKVASAARSWL